MKKPPPPDADEHQDDLLLPYAEGLLDAHAKERVEEHLSRCAQCSSELEGLRETITTLRENPEAFCLAPWQLYEYLNYGHDPDGMIAEHLEVCPACREISRTLSLEAQREEIPQAVLLRLQKPVPEALTSSSDAVRPGLRLFGRFRRLLRAPAIAAAAVAAAMLAVIVFYPYETPRSILALSTVSWQATPKPKSGHMSDRRAAVLLVLKDFAEPLPQSRIDSLYEALAPTMEMYERVRIVPPAMVKQAMEKKSVAFQDVDRIPAWLGKELNVGSVALVTVAAGPKGISVQSTLVDTKSGAVLAQQGERGVPEAEIDKKVRQSVRTLFLTQEGGGESRNR